MPSPCDCTPDRPIGSSPRPYHDNRIARRPPGALSIRCDRGIIGDVLSDGAPDGRDGPISHRNPIGEVPMIRTIALASVCLFGLAQGPGDGAIRLFDGRTLDGWKTSGGAPSKVPVEDGSINPHGCGGYMMIHETMWSDFVLSLDFKISKGCNSGVFIRTYPLTPRPGKDVGFNGIEVAIDDTTTAGYHDTGAIYDLVRPTRNAMRPPGQWNHLVITCDGPKIAVELNGETVTRMDLDEWTTPNRRPDGSAPKFDVA